MHGEADETVNSTAWGEKVRVTWVGIVGCDNKIVAKHFSLSWP